MEQARMLLAIVLSFAVFLVWNIFFEKKDVKNPVNSSTVNEKLKQKTKPIEKADAENLEKEIIAQPTPSFEDLTKNGYEAKIITINTPLYQVKISETGAVFKSFVLTKFREKVGEDSPLKQLISPKNKKGNFVFNFTEKNHSNFKQDIFKSDAESDKITLSTNPRKITFSSVSEQGLEIQKAFTFYPNSYLIGMDIRMINRTVEPVDGEISLSILKHWAGKKSRYGFMGPCTYADNKFVKISPGDLKKKNKVKGLLKWIAIQDRYFLSSIIPKAETNALMKLKMNKHDILSANYTYPIKTIAIQSQETIGFELYMGPKSVSLLKKIGSNLDKAVNFGWFDIIAKPCLWLMNFLYKFIPNYGIAIIILTILIKLIFWPLGNKSYKSMNEMKKLQPLMTEIRQKYKDDKKKMNEEVMNLYKIYKINPLGGCLPMVAQIPVFFALYQMLYGAIELRHAPFFWWINDLSAPDRLFDLGKYGFSIPFMTPPFGIPVLTIIMGVTMFVQQKLQPAAGDPTQAKMMMMMPIVFTVIFINFSSGLVLYWLVNNILSIAQQYYVLKKNA